MSAGFDIQSYMEELTQCLQPYLKDVYFPSEPIYALMAQLADDYRADEDDITEIIGPAFRGLGLQGIDVEEAYFMGVDEFHKKHEDLFNKTVNIVFFTDKELTAGMQAVARTSYLLRHALQDCYIKRHPQQAQRCLGWVDEETIDIVGPFLKDGRIPGWVYEEALRDLVADVGSYPLGQNIMDLSLNAMGAQILFLSKECWLPAGSDETAITAKLKTLLTACGVDLERCFAEGLKTIPREVLELARNTVFFGSAQCSSPYEAELLCGTLLSNLIQEEHARTHLDERVTRDVVNHDMALVLRTHAKDGYVPSFVVQNECGQLMALTRSTADVTAIRDGTMASLSLKPLLLEEQLYLLPGASKESIRQKMLPFISEWDFDKIYETGAIPDEYTAVHNQSVSMMFSPWGKDDERVIDTRIWHEENRIEERLQTIISHISDIHQRCLQGRYENILEYNASAGKNAEPLRFLVIMDFPRHFTPAALDMLESIVTNGATTGVYALIAADMDAVEESMNPAVQRICQSMNSFTLHEEAMFTSDVINNRPLRFLPMSCVNDDIVFDTIEKIRKGILESDKITIDLTDIYIPCSNR